MRWSRPTAWSLQQMGDIYLYEQDDPDTALTIYRKVLNNFPDTAGQGPAA